MKVAKKGGRTREEDGLSDSSEGSVYSYSSSRSEEREEEEDSGSSEGESSRTKPLMAKAKSNNNGAPKATTPPQHNNNNLTNNIKKEDARGKNIPLSKRRAMKIGRGEGKENEGGKEEEGGEKIKSISPPNGKLAIHFKKGIL
jgi:hypothetical protein